MKPGAPCIIHYAEKNCLPDPKRRERRGMIMAVGRGPGPWNVLVRTKIGDVVVPRGNVRLDR